MSAPHVAAEIASQPRCWLQAHEAAKASAEHLPLAGERVAVVGCGTSLYMAMTYAALREESGAGLCDAFPASEFPLGREYDHVIAITRSGTTTEVLELLEQLERRTPTLAITGDGAAPVSDYADQVILLDFADEQSVVQTRFATSTLALLRSALGHDVAQLAHDAERALSRELEPALVDAAQITFLGRGWTLGLAHEAALKLREAAGAWTESYPAMEYRHGPISIAQPGRVTWMFGQLPSGLADDVRATGAWLESGAGLDPMAELIVAQRVALAQALARGLDPDRPRNLSRAVVLDR
ncbi:MAG TPA: SIS domain-containing protein [Jatrophihabitans sp.]|jgi:fructoselysine-6-P-deglycase FrlB-like protein|nr:SIS domain-containing protein [Jatrophihabitans sp.]